MRDFDSPFFHTGFVSLSGLNFTFMARMMTDTWFPHSAVNVYFPGAGGVKMKLLPEPDGVHTGLPEGQMLDPAFCGWDFAETVTKRPTLYGTGRVWVFSSVDVTDAESVSAVTDTTSTTTIFIAFTLVPQVAVTVVPSAVDDATSMGKVAVAPLPVAPVHTGVSEGQLAASGSGAAVIVIVAPASPLATYNVSPAPGVSVVDVTPPDATDFTPTTVKFVVAGFMVGVIFPHPCLQVPAEPVNSTRLPLTEADATVASNEALNDVEPVPVAGFPQPLAVHVRVGQVTLV